MLFSLYFFKGNTCIIKNRPCELYKANNDKQDYCFHNAICINDLDNKICNCSETGYRGVRCEIEIDECMDTASSPCQNNATCTDLINDYNCTCQPGFAGKNCEENIDECMSQPCLNGKCVDKINAYQCDCYPGFNGTNCENDIDYCFAVQCAHGGKCEELNSTFSCRCLPGFTGNLCEVDIDECQQNPCQYLDANGTTTNNTCIQRSDLNALKTNKFRVNVTHFLNRYTVLHFWSYFSDLKLYCHKLCLLICFMSFFQ